MEKDGSKYFNNTIGGDTLKSAWGYAVQIGGATTDVARKTATSSKEAVNWFYGAQSSSSGNEKQIEKNNNAENALKSGAMSSMKSAWDYVGKTVNSSKKTIKSYYGTDINDEKQKGAKYEKATNNIAENALKGGIISSLNTAWDYAGKTVNNSKETIKSYYRTDIIDEKQKVAKYEQATNEVAGNALKGGAMSSLKFAWEYAGKTVNSSKEAIKSYYGTEIIDKNQKLTTNEKALNQVAGNALKGGALSSAKNALEYVVKIGGRRSNVVSVFDKTSISSLGNPRWFARVDMPHGNVNYHHINVNKAITGVKDPHIKISATTAQVAGTTGKVLNVVNQAAPIITAISLTNDAYQISKEVSKDLENGSSRNTVKQVATTAAIYGGGYMGASAGAALGTAIFPGIGTLLGAIVGGVGASIGVGGVTNQGADMIMDRYGYDVYDMKCTKCGIVCKCRRFETGHKEKCSKCE